MLSRSSSSKSSPSGPDTIVRVIRPGAIIWCLEGPSFAAPQISTRLWVLRFPDAPSLAPPDPRSNGYPVSRYLEKSGSSLRLHSVTISDESSRPRPNLESRTTRNPRPGSSGIPINTDEASWIYENLHRRVETSPPAVLHTARDNGGRAPLIISR